VTTGLLLSGPVEKIADDVGEFAAQPFGVRAVNVVDVPEYVRSPLRFRF
jgi:hypothetical protein